MAEIKDKQIPKLTEDKTKLIALFALVFISIIILLLAIWIMKQNVIRPSMQVLQYNQNQVQVKKSLGIGTETLEDTDINKDTDEDGLTDAEEMNVYKTSPYLADSDSDGIDDKTEIEAGEDPLCAAGNVWCENVAQPIPQEQDGVNDNKTENEAEAEIDETDIKVLSGQMDAAGLRVYLQGLGIPQEALDQLDDASLQAVYEQTLANMDLTQ